MKTKHYALALLAGLLLVLLAAYAKQWIAPAEWQRHQRAYNGLRQKVGLEPVEIGLRALTVQGQEERCVSCHLGVVLPAFPQPPFHSHPQTGCALPLTQQGCSGCHGGEPLHLTQSGAHGLSPQARRGLTDGGDRTLAKARIQAGCATCHVSRQAGVLRYDDDKAPEVAAGLKLFLSQGCASCHRIAGVFNIAEQGPTLTAVGMRRSREALQTLLASPQRTNPQSPMPPLTVGTAETNQLLTFLLAQVGPEREPGCSAACAAKALADRPGPLDHFPEEFPAKTNAATGLLWARRIGCAGCHRLSRSEPGIPDLTRVGWYRTEEQLRTMLRDPRKLMPSTLMPAYPLPEPVLEAMTAWLLLQRVPVPSLPKEVSQDLCRRCHGRVRDPKVVVLSKQPPVLEERKAQITKERFIEVATKGVAGTAMVPWGGMLSTPFLGAIYEGF